MHPHFLVIGAQKAGTTWLDRNLRQHRQIWLPPEKEIHYFDLPRFLPFATLLVAPISKARHWAKARLKRDWAKVRSAEQTLSWYSRYYFAPRTDRWYRSIFAPASDQICGETTPRYATLPTKVIARIHNMMPDLKIVYILRDPIDRMWSDAAMFRTPRFAGPKDPRNSCRRAFLENQGNIRHSLYAANLSAWESCYEPTRICVIFQDDIASRPDFVLRTVTDFLGIEPMQASQMARRRINCGDYRPIEAEEEALLAARLIEDLRSLVLRTPNEHAQTWLARVEAVLRRNGHKHEC
jgi:hypothetical protein